jgi:ATP-dependent Lhr-like helicase
MGPEIRYINSKNKIPLKVKVTKNPEPFRILWITPLRALANDTFNNLAKIVKEFNLKWTVELRSGDTSSHIKQKQKNKLP